jgi:biopolymer transport protein ExbD
MNNDHRNARLAPSINVTPLIDVLLVLLIIFMVISPARPSRFETKLPEQSRNLSATHSENLVVTINRDGSLQLNQQSAANLIELSSWLHYALDGRPADRKAVFIKAPRAHRYGEIVRVIDVMKAAGSAPIGLQLENLEQ